MRKDEIKAIVDYIDARLLAEKNFSMHRGRITALNNTTGEATVTLYGDTGILAKYDVNSYYQVGDLVSVMCIGADKSIPSNNLIIGQFDGKPNPLTTNNLLTNGDIEQGLSGWNFSQNVSKVEVNTEKAYMGRQCIAISAGDIDEEVSMYQYTGVNKCLPNELYLSQAYVMTEETSGIEAQIRTQWFNSSGGYVADSASSSETVCISSGAGWIPISVSQVSPSEAAQARVDIVFTARDNNLMDGIYEEQRLGAQSEEEFLMSSGEWEIISADYEKYYPKVYIDNVGLYGYGKSEDNIQIAPERKMICETTYDTEPKIEFIDGAKLSVLWG